MTIKYYSNKSNAKRAAVAAGLDIDACELKANGTGYAYVAKAAEPALVVQTIAEVLDVPVAEVVAEVAKPSELAVLAAVAAGDQQGAATALLEALGIPVAPRATEAPVARPTAGLALVKAIEEGVEAGVAAEEAPTRKGITIEKNRDEQNDIVRPSRGGICRAIWDACDTQIASGQKATIKWLKTYGEAQGWNMTTVTIQFYQWRKFNGITGRQA